MKTKVLISGCMLAALIGLNACSKKTAEECEANPEFCLAACITNPSACIDEGVLDENNSAIDSVSAVSKLPVRD